MTKDLHSKNIVVFRNHLLHPSETFIKAQSLMLKRYLPYFVGSRSVAGLDLPPDRVILINNDNSLLARLREKLFKLTLRPPGSLVRKLRLLSPQLIHAHFAFDAVFALPFAEALNIPMIVTLHGYDVTQSDETWRTSSNYNDRAFPRRRLNLIKSDRVQFIAVSEHIKRSAIEKGYPEDRISVHYIGVDTKSFAPVEEIPANTIVLFVGRLVEKKGCIYLIRAMQKVQEMIPTAELVIIGDGPLRSELEEESSRCIRHCTFMGMQDNATVKVIMNKSRIICVPSITSDSGDTEGLPTVIYEAMASGIPLVSTFSAGIPEAVTHGESGLLAAERDVEVIAANILRLLADENLWQSMSRRGQELVRERFDLERQTRLLECIYDDVISVSMKRESY